jgi:hypothetical protein
MTHAQQPPENKKLPIKQRLEELYKSEQEAHTAETKFYLDLVRNQLFQGARARTDKATEAFLKYIETSFTKIDGGKLVPRPADEMLKNIIPIYKDTYAPEAKIVRTKKDGELDLTIEGSKRLTSWK